MRSKRWWLLAAGGIALAGIFFPRSADAKAHRHHDAVVELGRRLFMDPTISRRGTVSCAECHDPGHGFSDPRVFSAGEPGTTKRHSQTLIDLPRDGGFHWDGEFETVAQLAIARLGTLRESLDQARTLNTLHFKQSLDAGRSPDRDSFERRQRTLSPPYYGPTTPAGTPEFTPLLMRLQQDGRYNEGITRAFGTLAINSAHLADAIETYVLSIRTSGAPYDRFIGGEPDALGPAARRGLFLFQTKANCASCHTPSKAREYARFTDGKFHNTGMAYRKLNNSIGGKVDLDGGRGAMSFVVADAGGFKTPTLRDVARRPPYMHDGAFKTLEEVVRYYDRGGTANPHLDAEIKPLRLTDQEVKDLVAFLEEGLTSYERPGLGSIPSDRATETVVKIVSVSGRPMRRLKVEVRPFGDRFRETHGTLRAQTLVTDRRGWLKFSFPATTHVLLKSRAFEIGYDRALPDYAKRIELVAFPKDQVTLRLRSTDKGPAPANKLWATPTKNGKMAKNETVKFTRVRSLKDNSAFYTAPVRPGAKQQVMTIAMKSGGKGRWLGLFVMDLTGGATEPIDLRGLRRPVIRRFTPGDPGTPPLRGRTTPPRRAR